MNGKAKLYCYIDETGLDTKGEFFIVVAVIVEEGRELLEKDLEKLEINIRKRLSSMETSLTPRLRNNHRA